MRSSHAIVASACLLACLAQPARAECPGQTDLEQARCTQIRKDPAAKPNADAELERRRELEQRERQHELRDAWRDGYRRGRDDDSQTVIIVPRDGS